MIIALVVSSLIGGLFCLCVNAQDSWQEYDEQWIKRSAGTRLDILNRAIEHYAAARAYFERGDFSNAKIRAKDALKVVPTFKESYELIAAAELGVGRERNAKTYQEKALKYEGTLSVIDEFQYLAKHIDRLRALYKPPQMLNRLVFYMIAIAGIAIVIFLITSSGIVDSAAMGFQHLTRSTKEQEEEGSDIIIGKFADDEEPPFPWWIKPVIFSIPFGICYLIVMLCGADTIKDVLVFTLGPGIIIDILIFILFFKDDDMMLPPRGGMR